MFNRIIAAAAIGLMLLAGAVTYAHSAECEYGSFDEWKTQMETIDATSVQMTDGDVSRILADKGPPPNGKPGVHYTAHLVTKDDMAAIFFFQEGCLVNRIGPAPKFLILQMFGQVEADQPYITKPVMMDVLNYAAS